MCTLYVRVSLGLQLLLNLKRSMALFRYFKRQNTELPDPHGPLAQSVPSSAIVAANSKVISVMESGASAGLNSHTSKMKRGQYGKYSSEQKAMIGKGAVEHGVVAAVRYYVSRGFPNLKENTRTKVGVSMDVTSKNFEVH